MTRKQRKRLLEHKPDRPYPAEPQLGAWYTDAEIDATVKAIQDSMDMRPFARVEDVTEDIEHIWAEMDDLSDEIEGVKDSVGFLLMGDEQSHWADD